jgi:putative ABC transport system permease protein
MNGPLKLAWRYIMYYKLKTLIMIGCIFLTACLPIVIGILLNQFNQKIVARADSTPAIIGAKGSDLDLTLHALYFKNRTNDTIPYWHVQMIRDKGWATPIPVYSRFTARGYPIVGTSLQYFPFRGLKVDNGRMLSTLGDCLLGWQVARELSLSPGGELLSDRESVLDIGGLYPLKMHVCGVLAPSNTPDDWAVFVDLKTAWIIDGLGHGHQDLANEKDEGKILGRDGDRIVASAAVLPYTEITADNLGSFHFHGEMGDFPISAIIAVASDVKNETILQGHYDTREQSAQFAKPATVVRQLMSMVFQVKKFFDANAILIAVSTVLLLLLVLVLSQKLRQREMETMFKLGCNRGTIAMLQLGELVFIFTIAGVMLVVVVGVVWQYSGDLVQALLSGS